MVILVSVGLDEALPLPHLEGWVGKPGQGVDYLELVSKKRLGKRENLKENIPSSSRNWT